MLVVESNHHASNISWSAKIPLHFQKALTSLGIGWLANTMAPRGRPLPALGSPRKVMTVRLCEKRQARIGGNARVTSHTISLDCHRGDVEGKTYS